MFHILLFVHSLVRWLLLIGLVFTLFKAYKGWLSRSDYSLMDSKVRLFTVTVAHIQGVVGLLVYFFSPLVAAFIADPNGSMAIKEIRYFAVSHALIMVAAIVVITIGSVRSKRKETNAGKFKTIALWFTIALVLIFFAIPWPFMPSSPSRPLLTHF